MKYPKQRVSGLAWQRAHPEVALVTNARRRARLSSKPFTVDYAFVRALLACGKCKHCGKHLKVGVGKQSNASPTLDEVRVGEGYKPGNVAVLCHECNRRKSDMTSTQLRALADWIDSFGEPDPTGELQAIHDGKPAPQQQSTVNLPPNPGTLYRC